MTSIDFYFNAPDKLRVACRLAGKALGQGKRMLIYAPGGDTAPLIDRLLWTWNAIGFLPHCAANDPLAPETPILIGTGNETPETPPGCEVLLNLAADCPPHFERFARMLEIVAQDEGDRKQARARYRYYRDRGYPITDHDLAREASRE